MADPSTFPTEFYWSGEAMVPVKPTLAAGRYTEGEVYTLVPWEARSQASHNHYFASIAEGWQNLPDHHLTQFPTPEHLRKKALIKAGYRDERSVVCESKLDARKVAAFIRPLDEYAIVVVRENVVMHLTAKSQSQKAMGKAVFEESKAKVLEIVADLIGTSSGELQRNTESAA